MPYFRAVLVQCYPPGNGRYHSFGWMTSFSRKPAPNAQGRLPNTAAESSTCDRASPLVESTDRVFMELNEYMRNDHQEEQLTLSILIILAQ